MQKELHITNLLLHVLLDGYNQNNLGKHTQLAPSPIGTHWELPYFSFSFSMQDASQSAGLQVAMSRNGIRLRLELLNPGAPGRKPSTMCWSEANNVMTTKVNTIVKRIAALPSIEKSKPYGLSSVCDGTQRLFSLMVFWLLRSDGSLTCKGLFYRN